MRNSGFANKIRTDQFLLASWRREKAGHAESGKVENNCVYDLHMSMIIVEQLILKNLQIKY